MKREYNIGLAILRTIMSFMVVLCHCWDASEARGILKVFSCVRGFAVPVFMLMSFILVQQTLVEHKKSKIICRFERLLIPHFGWAVIYWVIFLLIDSIFNTHFEHGITDIIWQILFGHSPQLIPVMWYQVNLIWLTLLFLIIICAFKKNYESVLLILGGVALIVQYSGINMIFDTWRWELKYPLGRFAEMLPIAVVGFMISSHKILDKLKSHMWIVIISSIITIGIDGLYGFFSSVPGYGYSGVRMTVVGMAFVAMFFVIPFDRLDDRIKQIIGIMTNCTMGTYCMHLLVSRILNNVISHCNIPITINSFGECIFIWILCFGFSWIGSLLFGKTKMKALFN